MPTLNDIAAAIEEYATLSLQESWDNSGWQIAPAERTAPCTGVMLCLDVSPGVIKEASAKGCNLVVSHHPLIFKGLRSITGSTLQEQAVIEAIRAGIAVYSSHTALDSSPTEGTSLTMGRALGLTDMRPLAPSAVADGAGLGVIGTAGEGHLTPTQLIDKVKETYKAPHVRVTAGTGCDTLTRIALCTGSGGEFIGTAIRAGAQAYITSDVRYHDFLDLGERILIIDTSHYESEICTKSIFSRIISQKFPNFAVHMATCEHNPVEYI